MLLQTINDNKLHLPGFDDDDKVEEVVFNIEGSESWVEESLSESLKYGCYKDKRQILTAETQHDVLDKGKITQVRFEVKEAGTYKFVAKFKSIHVEGSPFFFQIGQPKSKLASQEPSCSPISKSSIINVMNRIATEDDSWSPPAHTVEVKKSPFKFDEKKHQTVGIDQPKLSSIFAKSLGLSGENDNETDFSKVKVWRKAMMIPRSDIDNPMGLCVSTDHVFVASKSENRVLMYNMDGNMQKEIYNGREGFNKPSDMVSLRNGIFAIRSNSYVVTMDSRGRKISTIWEGRGGMKCFGLAQDDAGNLACLHETRDETFLKLFDPEDGKQRRSIDITDIIKDRSTAMCRFLTYRDHKFYITGELYL